MMHGMINLGLDQTPQKETTVGVAFTKMVFLKSFAANAKYVFERGGKLFLWTAILNRKYFY